MAPKRIQPRAIPTSRPTNAGWERSTTKIRARSSGANCQRIPARDASECRGRGGDHKIFSPEERQLHNYKFLDNDGKQAEISPVTFAYELHGNRWDTILEDTYDVRTDARGYLVHAVGPGDPRRHLKNSAVSARVLAFLRSRKNLEKAVLRYLRMIFPFKCCEVTAKNYCRQLSVGHLAELAWQIEPSTHHTS